MMESVNPEILYGYPDEPQCAGCGGHETELVGVISARSGAINVCKLCLTMGNITVLQGVEFHTFPWEEQPLRLVSNRE